MRYYAAVVVIAADTPELAMGHLAQQLQHDEVQFVGEPWEVAPIVVPVGKSLASDGFIPTFGTLEAIEQQPMVAAVIPWR